MPENVYAVSDSSYTSAGATALGPVLGAGVHASGVVADQSGTLAVVSGGGIIRTDLETPARATARAGALPQPISVTSPLTGAHQTIVAASGDVTLSSSVVLSGQQVVLVHR